MGLAKFTKECQCPSRDLELSLRMGPATAQGKAGSEAGRGRGPSTVEGTTESMALSEVEGGAPEPQVAWRRPPGGHLWGTDPALTGRVFS